MKLSIFFLLIPAAIAFRGVSSAQIWLASVQQSLTRFIDNPLRRSIVPQFILDTQHPWILSNRRKLERFPDAAAFLCTGLNEDGVRSVEATSEGLGDKFEIPLDLFDNLEIDNNRAGLSRPGWPNALERLGEMQRCPRALQQVKKLNVAVFVHDSQFSDLYMKILEPSQPPEQLLTLFGNVLESMTNLETLNWGIPKEYTHFFEEAFQSRNLTLPSVKSLEPGPSSEYLVAMCPNLERLQNGGSFNWYHGYMPDNRDWRLRLVVAAKSTPKVKRFAMVGGHRGWTPSLVSEVVNSMPQLESLGLLGSLGEDIGYTGIDTGDSGRLKAILLVVNEFQNLTNLDLPTSSNLGVGFNGGPGCGNVYFGRNGALYRRQITQEWAEATTKAGDIVIANSPQLIGFTIGGSEANVTRVEGEMVSATWPWTGRMEDWLTEEVPESAGIQDMKYEMM